MILIFSVNTNHESVAYRSFSPSKFEARGARKVTTGIDRGLLVKQIKVASNHMKEIQSSRIAERSKCSASCTVNLFYADAVPGLDSCRGLVRLTLMSAWVQLRGALRNSRCSLVGQHTWMRGTLVRFLVPSIQITPVCGVYAG